MDSRGRGRPGTARAEAAAVREAQERLDPSGAGSNGSRRRPARSRVRPSRFRDLLDLDLPRTENHLLAIITGLEAARGLQVAGS